MHAQKLEFFDQKGKKKSSTLAFATGICFLFCCFNFGQREAGKGFKGTKMQRERQQEQVEHDESMEENVGPLPINKLEVTLLDKTNVLHQKREDYIFYLLRIKV